MRPVKSYIAKRFQNSDAGLSLDTDALARYSDIIDLSATRTLSPMTPSSTPPSGKPRPGTPTMEIQRVIRS